MTLGDYGSDGAARRPPLRHAGILLHPTSLPGPGGVGDLGDAAESFVDWLAAAGQTRWQILPLGPTGMGNSPYSAFSAFAGNPDLVSLDRLVSDGLLSPGDLRAAAESRDADATRKLRDSALRLAAERFFAGQGQQLRPTFDAFRREQAGWLDDFCLFMAIRVEQGQTGWIDWPAPLRLREPAALAAARERLAAEIDAVAFAQFAFDRQWAALRRYANQRGVLIFGDIPIFVAYDSADVWANRAQFQLDSGGRRTQVAGVPPDYFSATGQLWGNPLYDWERMRENGFRWWIERFRAVYRLVDIARIDHFRGFAAYWSIPATAPTAIEGAWRPGPGIALFDAVRQALAPDDALPIVAEDLGLITPDVDALRHAAGFPGMSVLQFAFGSGADNLYLPHNLPRDTVVYSGTHDNDTTIGWYLTADERARDHVRRYLGVSGDEIAWDLIRAAWRSVAETAIVPLQDVLSLGSEARMNVPGRAEGNWGWQMAPDALDPDLAVQLRNLTVLYGRQGTWEDA